MIGVHAILDSFLFKKFYLRSFDGKHLTYEGPAALGIIGFNPATNYLSTISGRALLLEENLLLFEGRNSSVIFSKTALGFLYGDIEDEVGGVGY